MQCADQPGWRRKTSVVNKMACSFGKTTPNWGCSTYLVSWHLCTNLCLCRSKFHCLLFSLIALLRDLCSVDGSPADVIHCLGWIHWAKFQWNKGQQNVKSPCSIRWGEAACLFCWASSRDSPDESMEGELEIPAVWALLVHRHVYPVSVSSRSCKEPLLVQVRFQEHKLGLEKMVENYLEWTAGYKAVLYWKWSGLNDQTHRK